MHAWIETFKEIYQGTIDLLSGIDVIYASLAIVMTAILIWVGSWLIPALLKS
jgi:hypothetical protein